MQVTSDAARDGKDEAEASHIKGLACCCRRLQRERPKKGQIDVEDGCEISR